MASIVLVPSSSSIVEQQQQQRDRSSSSCTKTTKRNEKNHRRCNIGPRCDIDPRREREFHPPPLMPTPFVQSSPTTSRKEGRAMSTIQAPPPTHLLDAWFCSLPTRSVRQPFQEATVGKMIRRWAMLLVEGITLPDQRNVRNIDETATTKPYRVTIEPSAIASWHWFPSTAYNRTTGHCLADSDTKHTTGWIKSDVCKGRTTKFPLGTEKSNAVERYVKSQLYSQSGLLWLMSHGVRIVLENLLDDCGKATVDQLKRGGRRHVVPPTTKTSESGLHPRPSQIGGGSRTTTVAMHIRRGDACEFWTNQTGVTITRKRGRPCYATSLYIEAVQRFKELYGAKQIVIVTDSPLALSEVIQIGRDQLNMTVTYIEGERSIFGLSNQLLVGGKTTQSNDENGMRTPTAATTTSARVSQTFIEHRNDLSGTDKTYITTSLLAELQLLGTADYFVGTSVSWVSRLAFLFMAGKSSHHCHPHHTSVPPFTFLDQPFGLAQWESTLAKHCGRRSCACREER